MVFTHTPLWTFLDFLIMGDFDMQTARALIRHDNAALANSNAQIREVQCQYQKSLEALHPPPPPRFTSDVLKTIHAYLFNQCCSPAFKLSLAPNCCCCCSSAFRRSPLDYIDVNPEQMDHHTGSDGIPTLDTTADVDGPVFRALESPNANITDKIHTVLKKSHSIDNPIDLANQFTRNPLGLTVYLGASDAIEDIHMEFLRYHIRYLSELLQFRVNIGFLFAAELLRTKAIVATQAICLHVPGLLSKLLATGHPHCLDLIRGIETKVSKSLQYITGREFIRMIFDNLPDQLRPNLESYQKRIFGSDEWDFQASLFVPHADNRRAEVVFPQHQVQLNIAGDHLKGINVDFILDYITMGWIHGAHRTVTEARRYYRTFITFDDYARIYSDVLHRTTKPRVTMHTTELVAKACINEILAQGDQCVTDSLLNLLGHRQTLAALCDTMPFSTKFKTTEKCIKAIKTHITNSINSKQRRKLEQQLTLQWGEHAKQQTWKSFINQIRLDVIKRGLLTWEEALAELLSANVAPRGEFLALRGRMHHKTYSFKFGYVVRGLTECIKPEQRREFHRELSNKLDNSALLRAACNTLLTDCDIPNGVYLTQLVRHIFETGAERTARSFVERFPQFNGTFHIDDIAQKTTDLDRVRNQAIVARIMNNIQFVTSSASFPFAMFVFNGEFLPGINGVGMKVSLGQNPTNEDKVWRLRKWYLRRQPNFFLRSMDQNKWARRLARYYDGPREELMDILQRARCHISRVDQINEIDEVSREKPFYYSERWLKKLYRMDPTTQGQQTRRLENGLFPRFFRHDPQSRVLKRAFRNTPRCQCEFTDDGGCIHTCPTCYRLDRIPEIMNRHRTRKTRQIEDFLQRLEPGYHYSARIKTTKATLKRFGVDLTGDLLSTDSQIARGGGKPKRTRIT